MNYANKLFNQNTLFCALNIYYLSKMHQYKAFFLLNALI